MTVSATDLRRSNRLHWRRCANSDRTRLWIGRTSGHGSGLLVDRLQGRESPEADANVRHDHARAGGAARMVGGRPSRARCHPEERSIGFLEQLCGFSFWQNSSSTLFDEIPGPGSVRFQMPLRPRASRKTTAPSRKPLAKVFRLRSFPSRQGLQLQGRDRLW